MRLDSTYWKARVTGEDISRLNFLISAVGGMVALVIVTVGMVLAAGGNPYQVP